MTYGLRLQPSEAQPEALITHLPLRDMVSVTFFLLPLPIKRHTFHLNLCKEDMNTLNFSLLSILGFFLLIENKNMTDMTD